MTRRAPLPNEITFCEAFNILLEGVGEECSVLPPECEGLIFAPHIRAFADREIRLRDNAERVLLALLPEMRESLHDEDDYTEVMSSALAAIADRLEQGAQTCGTDLELFDDLQAAVMLTIENLEDSQ